MRTDSGGVPQTRSMTKAAAYGYAIKQWDPVTELAGVLNGPASGISPGTTRLIGVALAYSAASKLDNMLILTSRENLFEAQADGSDLVAANMGYNANLTTDLTGPTSIISGVQVDSSTVQTTSSLDVNIRELLNVPDNAYGLYARVELKINKHLQNPEITVT